MRPGLGAMARRTGLRPAGIRRQVVRFRHRGLRSDDVLVVSYPKSGSTWLRFLLAHSLTDRPVDFDTVRQIAPPLGRHRRGPVLVADDGRLIKSHEPVIPFHGLPGQRIIYLVRDGRHVARSYLEHLRAGGDFDGTPDDFVDAFLAGSVDGYGPWADHVRSGTAAADVGARVLVMRYEDLRVDTHAALRGALSFLGVEVAPERVAAAITANDKDAMRSKEATSTFLRGRRSDGSTFVSTDRRPAWSEVFGPAATRLDDALAPTLAALGYDT